ncbi:NADH:flavin oxidoreductase/NADH oxidase [Hyaloraphidium curvatum]|nr:NADH:flavin oxidoreductase/NADH oxidase [Hyaloraphidium curvatum]
MPDDISTPFVLPCGLAVKNRLAKAPMTESLADARTNLPNARVFRVYSRWARGGAGMLITGNVPVDRRHMEAPRNVALEAADAANLELYADYARACKEDGCRAVMQISHAGRQTPVAVNPRPKAPSDVGLEMPPEIPKWLLAKPVAMTTEEVLEVKERFVTTAKLAKEAGFDGIQVHAAHGYLISEFLNPKVNVGRSDQYGGSLENRMRLLREIVRGIRAACGPSFCVSCKLNSADFQRGGSTEEDNIEVLKMLEEEGADFVEVSGGSYESPAMVGINVRESTKKREAYFLEFAEKARKAVKIPLMVTGGFRTRAAMDEAIASGACDLIGLARPLCLHPELPKLLISSAGSAAPPPPIDWNAVQGTERSFESYWHTLQIQRMADGQDPDPAMKPGAAGGFMFRAALFEPSTGTLTRPFWDVIWPVDARGHATRWAVLGAAAVAAAYLARAA